MQALDEFSGTWDNLSPQSHLCNERYRVVEQRYPACHQEMESIPNGRVSEKSRVAGNLGGAKEMDDAAEGLTNGNEPFYYRVR